MQSLWFIFYKDKLLLAKQDEKFAVPTGEEAPVGLSKSSSVMEVGTMDDGTPIKTFALNAPDINDTAFEWVDLRKSFHLLPREHYLKAGKCRELIYWDSNTQYCGTCGTPLRMHTPISKRCPQCGREIWPALSPAIIVLVHKGNEALLVHARNFKGDYYGLVAGFVETGETLEEAVHREVAEETGITITNLRYFGSQPWPYPNGLMVGFEADYVAGNIHLQKEELSHGAWFSKEKLPAVPDKLSIARKMIDHWRTQD